MPRLSRAEIRKDTVQSAVVAMADTVGEVTGIVTTAVKDVAGSLGGLATELFELRDSARRAELDGLGDEDLIEVDDELDDGLAVDPGPTPGT
ncbi:hypothetical protein [Nocardioides sp. Kera G14]|uniref:hypothetical protein n=1 Tax=Nocardioides sp. Kera G14 TaxID=2884264 RepID=UPI001D12675D|nr:hypothetical protein [Nocardioides sp. Kera G14]UDY24001.1 hypothetical protein LH076_01505 [Nocardioides sp. Kera G14]